MFLTESHRKTIRSQGEQLSWYLDVLSELLRDKAGVERLGDDAELSRVEEAALERALHMAVELFIDSCNVLIDALIMRDPASYADIIEIMMDEQVISRDVGPFLQQAVGIRKQLVSDYEQRPQNLLASAAILHPAFVLAHTQLYTYAGIRTDAGY